MNKNLIITIVLVLGYVFNSNIAEYLYPEAATNYDQWLQYYNLRNQIYSILFFLTFLFIFFNSRGLTKSLAMFAVFISFASMIDKVFYNFYQFKASDYIVIAAGVMGGLYVHLRARD